MRTSWSQRGKTVAVVILGAALVVGLVGTAAAAGMLPGAGGPLAGSGFGSMRTPPPLTDEQQEILDRAAGLVDELAGIVDDATSALAAEDWASAQSALLDYVSTLGQLEATFDEFAASAPEGKPFPVRFYLGPVLSGLAGQASGLASVWEAVPEANRVPVREAVTAAITASDRPAFWANLARLIRGGGNLPPDPNRLRARLEQALQRAEGSLARTQKEIERLKGRMAELQEKITGATDPERRHGLEDLRRLAELELGVCNAKVARDEFAIQSLKERLAELQTQNPAPEAGL